MSSRYIGTVHMFIIINIIIFIENLTLDIMV